MMSFVVRVVTDPDLAKLLDTYLSAEPGSEERETTRAQLELDQQRTERIPLERHKQRMSALYVDAEAPDRWNRPTREISLITAYAYLQNAADDYLVHYYNSTLGGAYPELEQWIGRPTLPIPERPELPPWLTFVLPPKP